MDEAGFTTVRMDLLWSQIEKKKGLYDFSQYDKLVESMAERHIKILFILDYGNDIYDKGLAPYTDQGRIAFANFAKEAVERYKGKQIMWEIWNEPNGGFWNPKPDVDAYGKLAIKTIKEIRSADKHAFIVAPALVGFDYDFLKSLGKTGLFQYINAVSVHPYRTSNPETVAADYNKLRTVIAKYDTNNKNIKIFSGEWGYSTTWVGINETKQAQYCIREYLTNIMSGVSLSIWYDWKDDGINRQNPEHNFGTLYSDLTPKPIYNAIKTMDSTLLGYRYVRRMNTKFNDDYMLMFKKGDKTVYALWTTNKDHNIIIDLKSNNAKIVELTGKNYMQKVFNKKMNVVTNNSVKYISN